MLMQKKPERNADRETAGSAWLRGRRDLFIKNIVRDFLRSRSFFQTSLRDHPEGTLPYETLERWVGTENRPGVLWLLKEQCHLLWRDVKPDDQMDAFLFDWTVGAIFHEAMKLKENVYLVQRYLPAYERVLISRRPGGTRGPSEPFFAEIAEEILKGLHRLEWLFAEATGGLQRLLLQERNNTLLLRFILEERAEIEKTRGDTAFVDRLLDTIYPEGLETAYCIAGENYLEGSWYTEARMAFEEALRLNPQCREAKSGLRVLEKRIKEVTLMLEREYTASCAKQGISPTMASLPEGTPDRTGKGSAGQEGA
jgi:hypothetical protein